LFVFFCKKKIKIPVEISAAEKIKKNKLNDKNKTLSVNNEKHKTTAYKVIQNNSEIVSKIKTFFV